MKYKALSLVEVIVYVAIVGMIATTFVMFGIQLSESRMVAEQQREIVENGRFVMEWMGREIRDATAVSGSFGSHPSSLTLSRDDLSSWTVQVDGDVLEVDTGSGDEQLTSDLVVVTNFVLNDLTRASEPSVIQIELSLESADGLYSEDFQTSYSLRE